MGKRERGGFGRLKDQATAWMYDVAMWAPSWLLKGWIGLNIVVFVLIEFSGMAPGVNWFTNTIVDEMVQLFLTAPALKVLSDRGHLESQVTELAEDILVAVKDELRERQGELEAGEWIRVVVEEIGVKRGRKMKPHQVQALGLVCQELRDGGDWQEVESLNEGRHPVIHLIPSAAQLLRIEEGRLGEPIRLEEARSRQ